MRTLEDIPPQTYTKTSNHIQEKIPSSQLQSYSIIHNLPYSRCTAQSANNQNQQEGEISNTKAKDRIQSYTEIVNRIYVTGTTIIIIIPI